MTIPSLPPQAFQTFALVRPAGPQYWRKATCSEADCGFWREGWVTRVPIMSPEEKYIASGQSGREYTETTTTEEWNSGTRSFAFKPGQRCFQSDAHQVPVEREPLYVVRDGDRRGNPTGRKRVHRAGADWRDNMAEELGKVAEDRKQG